MKTYNKILSALVLAGSLTLTACDESFLEVSPNDRVTLDNFFQSENDLRAATAGLYNKVWFDFNDKFYYALGDGRSNNLYAPYSDYIYPFTDLTETSLTGPLVSAWQAFYNVVGQANNTINNIQENSKNVTEEQKNVAIAEARFMRGTAYWYLASLWGNVILIEDNSVLVNKPIVNTNPRNQVFEFAMRDLEFAAKHLPATVGQAGRLTKWSAFAMLSRVYLQVSGISDNPNSGLRNETYLGLARQAAEKVIEESGLSLVGNYADLFKVENNNNKESLFALQWVPNGDYGVINTHQAYFANGSEITGDDAAWGYYTFASYDMMSEYEREDSLRRKATFMAYGDVYPEINKANGGYLYEKATDRCNVKKGVVGSTKDTDGKSSRMNSALNTYMIRLAEVYLNYAEAILGNNASTTDAKALQYFNMVRARAKVPARTTLDYQAIRHERRVEFAMEGLYWYDLLSRSYYKQQEVLNYIELQDRAHNGSYTYDKNAHTLEKSEETTTRPVNPATAERLLLPYPESEMVQNPLLKMAPVNYTFTEERITDLFN
ncbi:MAG: RagB/SusD family nutrient uptake outer membrane protein [Paludibacter sp.]|nr:RagB/SusD family nutrient uptake outer membrane protein [Paludibacter sp.]